MHGAEAAEERSYRGLPGAFPYAFRRSRSWLFKAYAVVGALLTVAVSVFFLLALIVLIADTAAASDGTLSLMRAFFILVGLLIVLPIVAPVLFVARRHRREHGDDAEYDRRLAGTGFLFLLSVYLALIISTPPEQQAAIDGVLELIFGPALETLYALPPLTGLVPPIIAVLLIYGTHRRYR